jgi:two-component system response regulator TctD
MENGSVRILLVEDNEELVSLLVKGLERGEFNVDSVGNAGGALDALAATRYAAVVLDLGLPDEDGLSWLRGVRARGDSTPVLVLTARDGVSDRVTGLRAGADDYLVKPFAMEELVARVRAVLRRSDNLLGGRLTLGNVALDTECRQVTVDGTIRPFPTRETAVLEILLRRCGNVAPKRLFEDHLFGLSDEVGSNAVEVYVHRLRRMLADCGATVQVHTVRGVGYLLAEQKA